MNIKFLSIIYFIVLISSLVVFAGDEIYLPQSEAVNGWNQTDKFKTFMKSDLYGHINGGAEVFLELGFERLTLQYYEYEENEISIEIYRMTDVTAATGIYWMKCGEENRDSTLTVKHTVNRYQLMLQKNRYFVMIYNRSGSGKFKNDIIKMAGIIIDHLPEDQIVPELKLLPTEGLIDKSVRIIRGPYTLQAIYTLGEKDILSLSGKTTAIAADYKDKNQKTYMMIVVKYPNQDYANAAYNNIRSRLDQYMKIIEWWENDFILKDYEDRYVKGQLAESRLVILLNLDSI